jgi:hypothetical protein
MANATAHESLPVLNERILHALLFTPTPDGWGYPGFVWGPPGVGKTKMVAATSKKAGLPYVRLSPAERGEGQFGVVPVPRETEHGLRLIYPAPDWADEVEGGGVVFVDEFNLGGYALQAPMLGLIQLRTLGAHKFDSRVRMLAAANEAADAPGAVDLANSIANRFAHFRYEGLDAESWAAGLLIGFRFGDNGTAGLDARREEARVTAAWPEAYGKAAAIIGAFVSRRPDLFQVKPARGSKVLAWPSKRTWEAAALALASSFVHGLSEVDTDAYLTAIVGIDAVAELATFRAALDLPSAPDLLDGKVSWKHDPNRPDRTNVVLGSVAGFLHGSPVSDKARAPRAERAWELIGEVMAQAADLAVPAAETLFQARLTYPTVQSPTARKVQAAMKPITDAVKGALGN